MAITFGNKGGTTTAKLAGTTGTQSRVGVNVLGMKELQDFMNRFPAQLNNPKNLVRIFRKNSKPLQEKIKSNISGMSFKNENIGSTQLQKSVGFITTKASRKFGGGYVGLRARGAYKNKEKSGFYGAWIEVGRNAQSPTYKWGPAKPFIEPAYKATKNKLMVNMLTDARSVMYKEVQKLRKLGTLGYS
tara:strand:+ start:331 stop:894 length:564 start_codon:yes stop_codon:yes gene_type:complete